MDLKKQYVNTSKQYIAIFMAVESAISRLICDVLHMFVPNIYCCTVLLIFYNLVLEK